MQVESKSEAYQIHLERLHVEFDAEKQKYSREKDLLLNKAEEHRVKAKKFAEELSNLKQNHMQTKQEVGEVCAEMRRSRFCIQDHVFRFIHSYIYSFIYLILAKFAQRNSRNRY